MCPFECAFVASALASIPRVREETSQKQLALQFMSVKGKKNSAAFLSPIKVIQMMKEGNLIAVSISLRAHMDRTGRGRSR